MASPVSAKMSDGSPATAPASEEGPAHKKGKVPLAEVLNIMWKSEGKPEDCAWTWVALSVPGEGEECPITQEPISSSSLDFLPNVAFRKEDPEYSRIQLECGHAFSAVAITYQFFKNGMQCPLCRKGNDKTLSALCVPVHFRRHLQERLVIERAKDRVEADRENLASAMLAAHENYATAMGLIVNRNNWSGVIEREDGVLSVGLVRVIFNTDGWLSVLGDEDHAPTMRSAHSLSAFLGSHRMCIVAYVYEPGEDLAPAAVMELPADAWSLPPHAALASPADSGRIPYDATRIQRAEGAGPDPTRSVLVISVARSTLRELGRNVRHLQQPVRYSFVVGTRSLTGTVVEMSRSEMVDLTAPDPVRGAFGGAYFESQTRQGGFDVRHVQSPAPDTSALESVLWSMPEPDFLDFALVCILRAQETRSHMAIPGTVMQAALEVD